MYIVLTVLIIQITNSLHPPNYSANNDISWRQPNLLWSYSYKRESCFIGPFYQMNVTVLKYIKYVDCYGILDIHRCCCI